ncbi:MAG: hypothetical protein RLZZ488_842 [Pseudomonadota bacterium]|jgi:hypothetical protein
MRNLVRLFLCTSFLSATQPHESFAFEIPQGILPSRYNASLGMNFRPTRLYSQEVYLQDSWTVGAGVHWDLEFFKSELLLDFDFEDLQNIPNNRKQIGISTSEFRLSADAGVENTYWLPVGASLGLTSVSKSSELSTGEYVLNETTATRWSENATAPALKFWLGVPLIPKVLQINVRVQKIFLSDVDGGSFNFGTDIRFEF